MIDRAALLSDLQKLLQRLESDLLERSESADVPEVGKTLRAEYDRAKSAERTAQNYEDWRTDAITQAAAAWVLSCVFVRFLEDNRLIDPPKFAGPDERLVRARDEWELYLSKAQQPNERDYLLTVFDQLTSVPGAKDVFGEHNPIHEIPNWLSGDGAKQLLDFFQKIDANTGALLHDFTDNNWDTRFLGDLYQDLSEAARKKYALLQTPEFVEEFILDRTLDPALDEFGLVVSSSDSGSLPSALGPQPFKMIDPACGSGHFLLGAFRRILDRWEKIDPTAKCRVVVQRALDSIYGVDVNPYAVAIARFRLLLVALKECGVVRLSDAPAFHINVVCGDSLLHAPLRGGQQVLDFELTSGSDNNDDRECEHAYQSEDLPELKRILRSGQYHTVVANPPYITPKDRQLNDRYRRRFRSCHMKYSLSVPFLERIFQLAVPGGYTGQITANSFMKREFGKKLIEQFFPTVDLTHVVDTSGGGGAHIPGHKTGTVILFGRHRKPVASTIRAVMGIRGEPSTPVDPARGLVWLAIIEQLDRPGSLSEFVSVADSSRDMFHKHPWSIGGGGAAELKEQLEDRAAHKLNEFSDSIGITSFTLEDDIFILPESAARRSHMSSAQYRPMVVGDIVRDWTRGECDVAVFPYDADFRPIADRHDDSSLRYLWLARTGLANNKMFGAKTKVECGLKWYEFGRLTTDKLRTPLSIVFAFVATHNHFVLDRGGKVFNRSSPVIKLPREASEFDHLALIGLLNSSTACFWMKQVFYPKSSSAGDISVEKGKPEANRYEFAGTGMERFPIPFALKSDDADSICRISAQIDALATRLQAALPDSFLQNRAAPDFSELRNALKTGHDEHSAIHERLIALQEELDWEVYRAYGVSPIGASETVLSDEAHGIPADARPFFWNDDAAPDVVPPSWRSIYEVRRRLIGSKGELGIIEDAVFKRPWWGRQGVYGRLSRDYEGWTTEALAKWLLDRLESYFDFDGRMNDVGRPTAKLDIAIVSVAKLADVARQDAEFLKVGELSRDDPAFDVQALVTELVAAECVPLLPVLRYKPSGLIKRGTWERTWYLQRQEDAIDARMKLPSTDPQYLSADAARDLKQQKVGNIPVPTKYDSKDFLDSDLWRLRGKLDVPKERWISFPHCEGPDGTPVIAWAGYDHLQQARSISAYYVRVQTEFGGTDDARLIPLLACLIELLPWLKQWHNEPDAAFDGMRMGDYFEGFVNEEARQLGKTLSEIKAWQPPKKTGRQKKKGAAK